MKIKDLIKLLQSCEQEKEVMFAKDEEGNSIHPEAMLMLTDLSDEGDNSKVVYVFYPTNKDVIF